MIKCPISMGECMGTRCAFYDIINRRCPHGAESEREKLRLLQDIQKKLDSINTIGRNRWYEGR